MSWSTAIGIDLGTSYCCVGVWRNDHVEIVANDQGNRTTPTYVSFSDTGRLIGDAAKNQAGINPQNTVFNAMRLIGRKFDDPEVQSDIKHLPFKVFSKRNRPYIQVEYLGEKKEFSPEEIISMILHRMKEIAEAYLGQTVNNVVLTVPAYFNNSQRLAVRDAATIAGMNAFGTINGPTAAGIAYGLDRKVSSDRNILIFDLGGGTTNVSLLTVEGGVFQVKATAGDTNLGGEDFDDLLVRHFIQEFKRKRRKDISSNSRAIRRLRTACERAKRLLSSAAEAPIEIDSLFQGIDFYTSITRVRFEELCRDLFDRALEPVEKVLRDSKFGKRDVHEILLFGGSSRIPYIAKLISELFDGKEPNKSINPDEAAAYGAAVLAVIISGNTSEKIRDFILLDVVPMTLGIGTPDGDMCPILKRNTIIPTKNSATFSTTFDNETSFHIKVFEGDNPRTEDNTLLGEFVLFGIPPARRGFAQIEVTFDMDLNFNLQVKASEKATGKSEGITISNGAFSWEEIKRMVMEAANFNADEGNTAVRIAARNALESYAYNLRNSMNDEQMAKSFYHPDKDKLLSAVDETISWLDNSQEASKEEYEDKQSELESIAKPIMQKLSSRSHGFSVSSGASAGAEITPKDLLESYAHHLRYSIYKLESSIKETISWIDTTDFASKEEYDQKQRELQSVAKDVSRLLLQ